MCSIFMMMCRSQGVESDQCDAFKQSYEKRRLVTVDVKSTLADGLAVSTMGPRSFNTAFPNVDRVVTVRYGHYCDILQWNVSSIRCLFVVRMILLLQY